MRADEIAVALASLTPMAVMVVQIWPILVG